MIIKICDACGRKFPARNKRERFCSSKCRPYPIKIKEPMAFVCAECHKTFLANTTKRTYCSVECNNRAGARRLQQTMKNNGPFIRLCPICKQWFEATDPRQRFCSPQCQKETIKTTKEILCRYCEMPILHPHKFQYTCGSKKCKSLAALERRVLKYGPHTIVPTQPQPGDKIISPRKQIEHCSKHKAFKDILF